MLAASYTYDLSLDSANQRAALLELYYSTNGPDWTNQLVTDSQISEYTQLVNGVIDAGYALADGSQGASSSFPAVYTNGAELAALSTNCTVQLILDIGHFSFKQQWGSNVSYCLWSGVVCCQTVVCRFAAILCCRCIMVSVSCKGIYLNFPVTGFHDIAVCHVT